MNKKVILTILTVIAIIIIGIKGKSLLTDRKSEIANEALPTKMKISVLVIYAKEGHLEQRENFLAQLTADKSITLSTKLAGYIKKVYVQESQSVKKGTHLISIDAHEIKSNILSLQSTLATQQSDLALAKSIYYRNKKLYEIGGLAKEKLELSALSLKSKSSLIENTKQKISQLKNQQSYLEIRAPFDGVVDAIMMHQGDLAATGKPIIKMSNGKQKLLFSYAPSPKNTIQKSQKVSLNEEEIGEIKTIYTTAQNGLITAEVTLHHPLNLPSGSSINIDVITKEARGCIVPSESILHKKEGTFVMRYHDGTFTPQAVTIKIAQNNKLLISPCPKTPIAKASETKLSSLSAYKNVQALGVGNE